MISSTSDAGMDPGSGFRRQSHASLDFPHSEFGIFHTNHPARQRLARGPHAGGSPDRESKPQAHASGLTLQPELLHELADGHVLLRLTEAAGLLLAKVHDKLECALRVLLGGRSGRSGTGMHVWADWRRRRCRSRRRGGHRRRLHR